MIMDIIIGITYTFYQLEHQLVPMFAPTIIVILLILYFVCDSEKERGWLLVGVTIVLIAIVFEDKMGSYALFEIERLLDK